MEPENQTTPALPPAAPPTPEPVQPPVQPASVPKLPKNKIPKKLVVLSIVLLVVAIVLVAFKLILKNKAAVQPAPSPTAATQPSPTPTPDPTANLSITEPKGWETYQNRRLGIEFKYPEEWTLIKGNSSPTSDSFDTGMQSQEKTEGGKSINYYFSFFKDNEKNYEGWKAHETTKNLGTLGINNLVFEKYILADMYLSLNYIYKTTDNNIYHFYIFPYEETSFPPILIDHFNQILGTLKFIEPDETAGWKVFINTEIGFSFKYPSNLSLISPEEGEVSEPFTGNPQFLGTFGNKSTIQKGSDTNFNGFSIYLVSTTGGDFNMYLTKEISTREQNPRGIFNKTRKEMTISPAMWTYIDVEQSIRQYFLPIRDQKCLVFSVNRQSDSFLETFNQILSTFEYP